MFSGPYHRRSIIQQLRFCAMRADKSIWWMWETPPSNYPILRQHSQSTDASRKHTSSAILCLSSSCSSSTNQHWKIKIKSLLNPSAMTLSISTPQALHHTNIVYIIHNCICTTHWQLYYFPMLLKTFYQLLSVLSVSQLFLPVLDCVLISSTFSFSHPFQTHHP